MPPPLVSSTKPNSFGTLYLYDDLVDIKPNDNSASSSSSSSSSSNETVEDDGHDVSKSSSESSSETPSSSTSSQKPPEIPLNRGILFGSISVFISILGAALTFPFLQAQRDSLGCDALCYGSMQSVRSGLSLLGNVLIGRLSDRFGRQRMLWLGLLASLVSYAINYFGGNVTAMWLAMIPSSLLNQNFSVLKALFADYNTESGGKESERASAMGRLGMAVGVAFMVGPFIGATFLKSYKQAQLLAMLFTLISGIFLVILPTPKAYSSSISSDSKLASTVATATSQHTDKESVTKDKVSSSSLSLSSFIPNGLLSFMSLPAAQTPGAKLLFFMRCGMGLAFNVFMTVWTVSLKERFNFGPKEHAYFMGWIGLCYALSQGVFAKMFIKWSGEDPTNVLLLCVLGLSFGRVFVMFTQSLVLVYAMMALVIVALGVMNTAMSSACTRLASHDQVGGLFGVMEAVESLAGLIGPTLGGFLFRMGPNVPIISVVVIYMAVFVAVFFFYHDTIIRASSTGALKKNDGDGDGDNTNRENKNNVDSHSNSNSNDDEKVSKESRDDGLRQRVKNSST